MPVCERCLAETTNNSSRVLFSLYRKTLKHVQSSFVISTTLSPITVYLEEKIWSLFKYRIPISGTKIVWISGENATQEQFFPFPIIFSIYVSKEV